MENEKKSHKNGLMRCEKIMKNTKKIILEGSNKPNITPHIYKIQFLCQINKKNKKNQ